MKSYHREGLRAAGQLTVADLESLHGVPGAPRRLVVGRAHKLHRQLKHRVRQKLYKELGF